MSDITCARVFFSTFFNCKAENYTPTKHSTTRDVQLLGLFLVCNSEKENIMNDNRKRKLGTVYAPSEDNLNDFIKKNNASSLHEEIAGKSVDNTDAGHDGDVELSKHDVDQLIAGFKVFNDPVHGHFELPKVLFSLIDTPQFQRLREIKQLDILQQKREAFVTIYVDFEAFQSTCYLVFPGACHNRFEHSVGVAYLAGRLCKTLERRQPELGITMKDCLCVQIAGLCHDLGHGPFSHFFDGLFMPAVDPNSEWCHEDASVSMFDHMICENNLVPILQSVGLDETDFLFIKELIAGPPKTRTSEEWPYHGRSKTKSYLYEIVANKRTGIDVDKWDYFARDCYHLGISNNFDYNRFMKFARVVCVSGKYQICTRDKEVSTLYDMFHTRNSLHRRAYQHKTCKIIDTMLCEALVKANDHILLPGKKGIMLRISDCINDMKAYTHLTDNILKLIELSQDQSLKESQNILHRVCKRDLYKMIGQTILAKKVNKKYSKQLCKDILASNASDLNPDDFVVHIIDFDYGMKDKNPIDQVRFYDKNNPNVAIKVKKNQVSQMLPETFAEQHLRFYCKKNNIELIQEASLSFKSWCNTMTCPSADVDSPELSICS